MKEKEAGRRSRRSAACISEVVEWDVRGRKDLLVVDYWHGMKEGRLSRFMISMIYVVSSYRYSDAEMRKSRSDHYLCLAWPSQVPSTARSRDGPLTHSHDRHLTKDKAETAGTDVGDQQK